MAGTASTVTALEKRVSQWKAEQKAQEKGKAAAAGEANGAAANGSVDLATLAADLVATLKAGRATTAEQKASLYSMLAVMTPDARWSADIVTLASSNLSKETQEASVRALMAALERHLSTCMQLNSADACAVASKALSKDMVSAKIPTRKAVTAGVGQAIWAQNSTTEAGTAFTIALLPTFDVNLKNAATKTLTSPFGPLEGYVAVASLLGRASQWGNAKIDSFLTKNELIKTLADTTPKPSFLLNEKVIKKVATADEEIWLVRAMEGLLMQRKSVMGDRAALEAVASAFRQVAINSKSAKARGEGVVVLHEIAKRDAKVAATVLTTALTSWIVTLVVDEKIADEADEEDAEKPKEKEHSRTLRRIMAALCSALVKAEEMEKIDVLIDLFVLAHHPELGIGRRQIFQGLCQMAKVDPRLLINTNISKLIGNARQALSVPSMRQAALDSLSTLVLLSPDEVADLLTADIRAGLELEGVSDLTPQDLGIWRAAPDALYVDVLTQSKDKSATTGRKGKESAMEKWDAELRESLAKKKADATRTLTKDQQVAVDQQMKIEREVRATVTDTRTRLSTALAMIVSIAEARTHATDERMAELLTMLLSLLSCEPARQLVANEAVRALDSLSTCCSERIGEYISSVRLALLRTTSEDLVSEDESASESIKDLTLSILYRLRILCEQAPLDLASISFVQPLLSRVIQRNGLGVGTDDEDGILEQVQLALEIITLHGTACRDTRFPRLFFVEDLAHIVSSTTQLAKDAVSALRTLGDAMKANASMAEIDCLLRFTMAEEVYVRTGALQALQPLDLTDIEFCIPIWLAYHDEDEENARLAAKAWEENGLDVPSEFAHVLLPLLEHTHGFVCAAAAKATAGAVELHPESASRVAHALFSQYEARNAILETEYDKFGLPIEGTSNREDPWKARRAIGSTFYHTAPYLSVDDVVPFFDFAIHKAALGDRSEPVRQEMLRAAMAVVDMHGKERLSELITMFESFLQAPASKTDDDITEAVIILFGRLAKHLSSDDSRIGQVIGRLVDALRTPSESVQVAVAECLVPLVSSIDKDVPQLVEKMFDALFHAAKYGERRGAAYGLAGLIKGRGLSSIAEFNVMGRVAEVIEDKKQDAHARQGAMMLYETLLTLLQRLFEPYVPQILPQLLSCFGDSTTDVRDATQETARVMMQNLSGYAVRLIMPSLLSGLDDKQWRTKRGAIELLGAVAYCAPRQLSHFLPTVIPHLNEPIKDSHKQVRLAAESALKGFGDVISNPEVKKLVPVIMKALVDPVKTPIAQKAILTQKWIHVLDGPSLALLIPVIDRGLRERGAQVQRDAARIVGNLASLTDSKDFVPYLHTLVPLIRTVLVSPVPDARATAAKSLGTLVERLGEIHFVDLVPSLLQILKSDLSSVDRQGSAQGLAEVLAGLGVDRLEALLPDIINNAHASSRASVRESHILLLIFLPATFGLRFAPYLGRIIPPILGGIADDTETVREASMRAGRMIIANYSARAVDLLLPELEVGLFDENWRIRLSSVQLISDLLFRLAGITGTNEVENDEVNEAGGAEQNVAAGHTIQKSLGDALGIERRNELLAKMYVLRQDVVVNVRQAALQLWKAIVNNTPKVAREILTLLLDLVVNLLPRDEESREMAGRAMGELVSKLGERILGESVPILRLKGLSEDASLRTGVALAVIEVLNNGTDDQLEDHQDSLVAIVRHGLTDNARSVREAAAQAFDALHDRLGAYAIDEIVPGLLESLEGDDEDGSDEDENDGEVQEEEKESEIVTGKANQEGEGDDEASDEDDDEEEEDGSPQGRALYALVEMMKSSAYSVFPAVLPTLLRQPITQFNASALSLLAGHAGGALHKSLQKIITAYAESIEAEEDDETRESLDSSLSSLLGCIYDSDGIYALMEVLLEWTGELSNAKQKARGCRYFALFCDVKDEDADMGTYGLDWVQRLVSLFDEKSDDVVDMAVAGLEALIKIVPKEDLESIAVPLRETLQVTGRSGSLLPGFMRPRGAAPLGAVFLAGLMNGTAEQREMGALGLADIVSRSSADSIKPLIVSMIGPLIRSCGDRHTSAVKRAILYALTAMLRFPQHCKPFFPQLQRSFQKSIMDAADDHVREQAEEGLGKLMDCQANGFKPS